MIISCNFSSLSNSRPLSSLLPLMELASLQLSLIDITPAPSLIHIDTHHTNPKSHQYRTSKLLIRAYRSVSRGLS